MGEFTRRLTECQTFCEPSCETCMDIALNVCLNNLNNMMSVQRIQLKMCIFAINTLVLP